ncbi:Crp/Fnr family transcriptional regulator [Flammeovirga kamogawensis]|uniref:Crp/Fnr family transcriptional regulator n=1 Tax=Flammeovirga kamogawensis TaxID=373891 RepID=A0ABX8GRE0_9BACT|nr:Crp/Fnr family transcriptional regulator [Flammeovirga kamogawensis]MBB6462139.1 CRP-like cAMP-binding protein [Flammeovirga kamogawensis]QWG05873.1 Crp/Fnr family transcriptional regulator [Flammeovirga kamogawensis]TRX67697.1 Crp/Fnr family transcriptional regulator [Flammeovirga kamogawensis]
MNNEIDKYVTTIVTYFDNIMPLTDNEKEFVRGIFEVKKIRRRQYLSQSGDIEKYMNFIVEGALKMYYVDDNGSEHNMQFAIENHWINDIKSFYKEVPSRMEIEALENCIVLRVSLENFKQLYEEHPKFNRIFRVLLENAYMNLQERVLDNISFSAREKYLNFSQKYPYLLNRISNVQIASFLGITPEFLSKIRKELSKK